MKIRANMHFKDAYTCDEECIVERAVTISSAEFDYMCKHLLEDNLYIEDNLDAMFYDGNKLHCLLLINESTGDGLLINSEGSNYARYHSYIPNAKMLWDMKRYPSLKKYANTIISVADDIMKNALNNQNEGCFEVNIEKYEDMNNIPLQTSLINDMLWDTDLIEDGGPNGDIIEIELKSQIPDNQYRKCYNANDFTEIEIICAKHALWIYDEKGGEQADFSNCLLENVDLSNCNLCAADFSSAELINCNLDDASMCSCDFENVKFRQCSIRKFGSEESNFKSADFYNCDLRGAYFTHSNFSNSKIDDCNLYETDFTNCCLDSWKCENCNLNTAYFENTSFSESEWVGEGEEHAPSMTM